MRIVITGGRNYTDREKVMEVLAEYAPLDPLIVHGGARGADRLAGEVAEDLGLDVIVYPARWEKWGKSAGFRRNAEMLCSPTDLVIAFPGGRGTSHCVQTAYDAGIETRRVA